MQFEDLKRPFDVPVYDLDLEEFFGFVLNQALDKISAFVEHGFSKKIAFKNTPIRYNTNLGHLIIPKYFA